MKVPQTYSMPDGSTIVMLQGPPPVGAVPKHGFGCPALYGSRCTCGADKTPKSLRDRRSRGSMFGHLNVIKHGPAS